ncbi:hypothetical protein COCON_G00043210 [Conger conger]|uniref:SPIN-DOC-like zinc-finger domain-containing protein n=1 Tax=Conger conger TaxID=82655 RepID=A0A9Q1I327_CONCO|nr:uncharacterized protein si:dkey-28a3.2 [Conger conger]XP_061092828.1 uncharacterized protein si:dkey-28a3.2 [Conger conger]KAJ8281802.1 hypothetical protein COCON_G00043210 [Conger conger]
MDRMQNSSSSRYRPASEFDEATLARKREYWRIKKREQRAKLSVLKKERLKEVNTAVCKSRPSAGQLPGTKNGHMAVALGVPGPTLLKSDGTYEAGLYHNPSHNFENISNQGETEGNAGPTVGQICASQEGQPISASQKDRWFQKIKLNNVLPQFPTASSDSRNSLSNAGRKAVGCSSIGAVSGNFSPTKLNGARADSFSQVPAIKIKVQQTGLAHCEDQNEKPVLNGSSSTISPQHNLAPQTGIYLQDYPSGIRVPVQSPGPGNNATMSDVPSFTQIDMLESTIKKEVVDLLPEIGSPTTLNSNNQTVFPKGEELNEKEVVDSVAAAVEPVAAQQASKATACHQRLQDGAERWGPVRSRMQRQKFLESQRIISQRNVRRAFSPAVALSTKNAQRNSMEETDEDRMARKREYWRIKKREQRAKLSGEVKAKMKERDSLLRRVKRYQCILDEMRRARMAAPKSQQSVNIPPSDSETIGGFIKEDGTMTSNIPQASANYRLSEQETLAESHTFSKNLLPVSNYCSGNSVLRKPVEITAPPPLKCATQMKGTSYPNAMTSLNPPRLVSNRARPASNTIPKNLQNTHTTMPQTSNFLRRPHNLQNTYPGLTLLKHRQVVGKQPATPLAPGGLALKRVPTGSSCPTTVPKWHLVPELSEEERMAKKREYWRIKKREQRAKRSARARQTLFQSKYSSVIQRQQSQRILSARRTASLNSLRSISTNRPSSSTLPSKPVIPTSIPDKQANIKQEEEPGPTEDVCGGQDPPDIKPCLSPPPEQPVEQDPSTGMDSQATTLLAVASMKKLLEESLSSVADSNVLPSCKREQVSSEEDVAQVEVKPSLPSLSQAAEGSEIPQEKHHSALGSTPQSAVLHAGEEQSRSCLKPSQVPSTSQAPSCQSLASSQAGSPSSNVKHSHTPLSSPSSTHAPICRQATSSDQPFQLRRVQRLREKRIGQHCCSPVPPRKAVNSPSQPDEDVLRKKREYWKIAKREQRAKKATQEREMRKLVLQGKQPIQRLSQGAPICTVKIHKPELRNVGHNSPPTLHTTNSPPLALSSATGSLTSLEAVTTLPIRKVFTPVKSIPLRCPNAFKNKSPAKDPPGKSSSLPVADSHASLICSTLPYPAGGNSRGIVQSGGAGSAGQLLLVGSQQNRASNPDAPQVKRWQMQVQGSTDAPSSQSSLTKKLPPTSALQVGGTLAQGGAGMLTGRPQTYTPPSCNVLLRVGQEDARKPPDPSKPKTVEELDEDLRKKREYWRVKKKEQRARKAARERELKRQGTTGSSRAILPVKELPESLDTQGQVSDPSPSKASENPQLLPSTSSEYNDQAQLGLTAAGKDELDLGIEAVEEDEGGEEGHEDTPCSEASWRTRFLMDFDPLNQLLVCMVCGEMQHSHSVAGVRGHIEEAHPDTLALEARERQRILEAWDEQVFLRESFFSNQLQQHSAALSGDSLEGPAEVEVMVDLEESPAVTNQSKASKAKSGKKA